MTTCALSYTVSPRGREHLGNTRPGAQVERRSRLAFCSGVISVNCQQAFALQSSGLYFTDVNTDGRWNDDSSSASIFDDLDDHRSVCSSSAPREECGRNTAASDLANDVSETHLETDAGAEAVAKFAALELDLEMKSKLPALKLGSSGCDMMPGKRASRPRAAMDVGTPRGPSKAAFSSSRMTAAWSEV